MGIETIIGGAIGLGSSFLSNRNRSRAIRDATNAQVGASQDQINLYRQIYQDQVGRSEPFRQGELQRLNAINQIYGFDPIQDTAQRTVGRQFGGVNAFANPNLYGRDRGAVERQFQLRNIDQLPDSGGFMPQQQGGVQPTIGNLSTMDRFNQSPFGQIFTTNFGRDKDRIDSQLADSGLLFSGARMNAIENSRARNFQNAFSQYFSGLFGQPSMAATGAINTAASNYGAGAAAARGNIGAAQAEGAYGRGESRNAFLGDILNTGGWALGRSGIFG